MSRQRYNNLSAKLGAPLSIGDTTITFQSVLTHDAGVPVPTIVAPDYIPLTLEPSTSNFEVVNLTAYTSGATTGTCSTVARTHGTAGVSIVHAPTVDDFGGWEAVTVPTDVGSWDVANAVGTWDFSTPGQIAQTDVGQNDGAAHIFTLGGSFGTAWAVEADMRLDTVSSGDSTIGGMFGAGLIDTVGDGSGYALGVAVSAAGAPYTTSPVYADAMAFGDGAGFTDHTVALGGWHTYSLVASGSLAFFSFDGVQVGWGQAPQANYWRGFGRSPFGLLGIAGAVTFRNLKAWRIPLPTLT